MEDVKRHNRSHLGTGRVGVDKPARHEGSTCQFDRGGVKPGYVVSESFKESRRSLRLLHRQGAIAQPLAPGFTILEPVLNDGGTGIATPVEECRVRP